MKKALGIILIAVICLTFGFNQIQAGEGCGSKDVSAKHTSSSKAACYANIAKYCTPEECAELENICKKCDGKCESRTISIKGMTCTGCENSIKTTISKIDGVLEVLKVSHTKEVAIVCVDPAKIKNDDALLAPILNKGYKAEIITVAATASTDAPAAKTGCAKTCTDAQIKACGASKTHQDTKKETK